MFRKYKLVIIAAVTACALSVPTGYALATGLDLDPDAAPVEKSVGISPTLAPASMITECEKAFRNSADSGCLTFLALQAAKRSGDLAPGTYNESEVSETIEEYERQVSESIGGGNE